MSYERRQAASFSTEQIEALGLLLDVRKIEAEVLWIEQRSLHVAGSAGSGSSCAVNLRCKGLPGLPSFSVSKMFSRVYLVYRPRYLRPELRTLPTRAGLFGSIRLHSAIRGRFLAAALLCEELHTWRNRPRMFREPKITSINMGSIECPLKYNNH